MSRYGPAEPLGATGLVLGRFLPLHRGHEYLIELARASVEKLTVVVLADEGDLISHRTRMRWIAQQYPDVRVEFATSPRDLAAFGRQAYLFAGEPEYAEVARAIGAELVVVDASVVPIRGAVIRRNPMEHFRYIARPARPWFVRRVAVVGPERSGKTALWTWLRERFGCLAVPAHTEPTLTPDRLQRAARTQIATEDALATQLPDDGTAGILLCNTDLFALSLWAEQRFEVQAPGWIRAEAERRPSDLYLACGDDPRLGGDNTVRLAGSFQERCTRAADALVELFASRELCSVRGQLMK